MDWSLRTWHRAKCRGFATRASGFADGASRGKRGTATSRAPHLPRTEREGRHRVNRVRAEPVVLAPLKNEAHGGPVLARRATRAEERLGLTPMKPLSYRQLAVVVAFIPCSSFAQASFQFDVGIGAAIIDPGSGMEVAPALDARAGLTLGEHFTGSARGLAVLGRDDTYNAASYRAWATTAELRLHAARNGGLFQPFLAFGVGIGKLSSANYACVEDCAPITGKVSHYEQLSLGAHLVFRSRFVVALEAGTNIWHGLSRAQGRFIPRLDGDSKMGGLFLASFGWRIK